MTERRRFRVAERIRELLAKELPEMADPRFQLVTISRVITSPDLNHAKVFWNVYGGAERIAATDAAFTAATGRFRALLARELKLRAVPQLRFIYDDTLDTCEEVGRLLARAAGPGSADE